VVPPSGEQFEIAHGDQRAVVVEVGGGLRSLTAGGRDVLDGYAEDAMCRSGRGQVLLPWPNRIADGAYAFDGRDLQLDLTEPTKRNAIHGLVRWASWTATEHDPSRILMTHRLHPRPGYPFSLELAVEYALDDHGLAVHTRAKNLGEQPCPFGAGAHPYVTLGEPPVDGLLLHVPATSVLQSDERGIPVETISVSGTSLDFRRRHLIGPTVLDHCYTDLERDDDGLAHVRVEEPRSGTTLDVWLDSRYAYVMVFTGDPLPDVDRRSLAVEPMTCAPNAFRTGESLIVLEPGETFTGTWGIRPGRADTGDG
jgi:aldose 1-epimerase